MNDSSSANAPLFAQPWAMRLGVTVLAGFTLILGLAFRDQGHRTVLETTSETTAAGDAAYFAIPEAAKLPLIAASVEGRPLYVVTGDTIEVRDTHAVRVLTDPGTGRSVYRPSAAATDGERRNVGEEYLLKVEPNKYLRAQSGPPTR